MRPAAMLAKTRAASASLSQTDRVSGKSCVSLAREADKSRAKASHVFRNQRYAVLRRVWNEECVVMDGRGVRG